MAAHKITYSATNTIQLAWWGCYCKFIYVLEPIIFCARLIEMCSQMHSNFIFLLIFAHSTNDCCCCRLFYFCIYIYIERNYKNQRIFVLCWKQNSRSKTPTGQQKVCLYLISINIFWYGQPIVRTICTVAHGFKLVFYCWRKKFVEKAPHKIIFDVQQQQFNIMQ